MLNPPTLGGEAIFGSCCHVIQHPDEVRRQEDEFFAVPGVLSLFGALRHTWTIQGVLVADDVLSLASGAQRPAGGHRRVAGRRDRTPVRRFTWASLAERIVDWQHDDRPVGPASPDRRHGWMIGFTTTLRGLS